MNLGSLMGLGRSNSKMIGLILMGIGFFLATPPGFPPDDILNVMLADFLARSFQLSIEVAILLTYTLVAWSLIYLGASIYPYNTARLLSGFKNRLIRILMKTFTNPLWFIGFLTSIFIVFFIFLPWYQTFLLGGLGIGG